MAANRLYEKKEPSYHEISAGIRLGDKYKITEWYSQSLKYPKRQFPSTLDSWRAQKRYVPPGWGSGGGIGAIGLCRKAGALSILPSAFISCICAESDVPSALGIAYGLPMEDGSRQYLSPDDLTVCLKGKISLRMATITAVFRIFEPAASAGCKTSSTCENELRDVLLEVGDDIEHLLTANPFSSHDDYVMSPDFPLCKSCTTMVKKRSLKEYQDIWNQLPELLGIDVPGWAAQ